MFESVSEGNGVNTLLLAQSNNHDYFITTIFILYYSHREAKPAGLLVYGELF